MNAKLTVILGALVLSGCSTMNHDEKMNHSDMADSSSKGHTLSCDSPYEASYGKHAVFNTLVQNLNKQSGCDIQTDISDTGSVNIMPAEGNMTVRQTVKHAISGTRLRVVEETAHTIKIK